MQWRILPLFKQFLEEIRISRSITDMGEVFCAKDTLDLSLNEFDEFDEFEIKRLSKIKKLKLKI